MLGQVTKIKVAAVISALTMLIPAPAQAAAGIEYMEPAVSGVSLTTVATAGDSIDGYLIGGIPDGMGVIPVNGKLRILTNHEWSNANPIAAARASTLGMTTGSYISEMHYDLKKKAIVTGKDFMEWIEWFDYQTGKFGVIPTAPAGAAEKDQYGAINHSYLMNRFCSSTLADAGEFYNKATGAGYKGAVYLTGEEGSDESRGFAGNQDGEFVQVPGFGLAAWETFVNAPTTSNITVVMGNEDGSATDSQLFMYVGTKTKSGEWYERAGLTNGKLYVMASDVLNDNAFRAKYAKGVEAPASFKQIDYMQNGKLQNDKARELGMTLARVEDGHFDPQAPNDYYFVTTESNKDPKATAPNPATPTVSRDGGALWRLRFIDINNPLKGGTLTMLLDGSEAPLLSKPDNIVVDNRGNVLIQEDPGNNALVSRIVAYRIKDGKLATVAKFKEIYFNPANTATFITQDEESSGIVDVTAYFKTGKNDTASYYMLVAQIHASPTKSRPDLSPAPAGLDNAVEGGQWYLMKVDDWGRIYGN
jgi:secreted PhoX family phosphatase